MVLVKPILRIFDYDKAIEFYIQWMGFTIDWQHCPEAAPVYLQVSLGAIVLHLSGHHGDCCPGARIYIENFKDLPAYHQQLLDKNYIYNRPGLEKVEWSPTQLSMEAIDPFGNRLTFNN